MQVAQTIDSTTQVSETLAQADQAVNDALARTETTVDETLAQADQTVDDALARTEATVDETLAQADQTVDDALAPTEATVADTVAQADQTVDDALARAEATVDEAVAHPEQTVSDALADGKQVAAAPATEAGEAATGGAPPAAGTEAVAAPTGGDGSPTGAPGAESGVGASSAATPVGDPTGAGSADGLLGGLPFGDVPLGSQPFAESLATGPAAHGPVAAAAPPTNSVGSGLDGIVTTATDPRTMTAAGVVVLAGGALGIWNGGPRLADASVMFTNFRLLPCLIKDGLVHQVGDLTAALSRRGLEAAAHVAVPPGLDPPQGVAGEASATSPPAAAERLGSGTLIRYGVSFHEGFEQGIRGSREITDPVADSRLLIQLGMGLGSVYAMFLSVWFWATRLRRHPSA